MVNFLIGFFVVYDSAITISLLGLIDETIMYNKEKTELLSKNEDND